MIGFSTYQVSIGVARAGPAIHMLRLLLGVCEGGQEVLISILMCHGNVTEVVVFRPSCFEGLMI
jgi:hypothetical protein